MNTNDTIRKYVCGFAFDSTAQNVALIQKNRGPSQMAGFLNGIGGKMEVGESPRGAQSREFLEEAGVLIPPEDWMTFHIERYLETGSMVYFMVAKTIRFHEIKSMEDEKVKLVGADPLNLCTMTELNELFYNLPYLIPMAQCWLTRPGDRYHESS